MNNVLQLTNAVNLFKNSKQTPEDYTNFIMVVQGVTRQGSGLMWSQINKILLETLQPENTWLRIFPTYEDYMYVVDQQLESTYGCGHVDLDDYNWMDAYNDEVVPSDVVQEFNRYHGIL